LSSFFLESGPYLPSIWNTWRPTCLHQMQMIAGVLLGSLCMRSVAVRLRTNSSQDPVLEGLKRIPLDLPTNDRPEPYKRLPCVPAQLCASPFDCQQGHYDTEKKLATADGHANWRTWCGVELPFRYEDGAIACAAGKLEGYGRAILKSMKLRKPGHYEGAGMFKSIFAHHCFSQGFCDDTVVNVNTTVEESEALCDKRYGRENWASLTGLRFRELAHMDSQDVIVDDVGARFSPEADNLFGMVGCAQAVHHCDVHFCRTYFCPEGDWRAFAKPNGEPKKMAFTIQQS